LPVFRWFNRFLKGQSPLIEMAATEFFLPDQLRVFDKLPEDEVNTRIDESFVRKAVPPGRATTVEEVKRQNAEYVSALREKVFAGWPAESGAVALKPSAQSSGNGLRCQAYTFDSQRDVNLRLLVLQDAKVKRPEKVLLTVIDTQSWTNAPAKWLWLGDGKVEDWARLQQEMQNEKMALAFIAPRGVEPSQWLGDPKKSIQIRRRFMLLGQTLDSMRVWDIRRAAQAVKALPEFARTPLHVRASGQMGVNAAYAALFEPEIKKLRLDSLPASQAEGPDYLNVLKVWDLPQLWEALGERADAQNP
jgi:hypothetical protein